jgi:hypothetical protein
MSISPVIVTCAIEVDTEDGDLLEISTLEAGGFEPVRVRLRRA